MIWGRAAQDAAVCQNGGQDVPPRRGTGAGAAQCRAPPKSRPHRLLPAGPAPGLRGWCIPLPQPLLPSRLGQALWGKPSDVGSSLRLAHTVSTRQGRQCPGSGEGSQGKNQFSCKMPVRKWISACPELIGFCGAEDLQEESPRHGLELEGSFPGSPEFSFCPDSRFDLLAASPRRRAS